jgi:hypothetical protein
MKFDKKCPTVRNNLVVLGQGLGRAAHVHGPEAAQQRTPGAQPPHRVLAVQRQPRSSGCDPLLSPIACCSYTVYGAHVLKAPNMTGTPACVA